MSLEVTVQVALVGELEFVYQFLETLVTVHECHLKLYDSIMVYNLFCVLSAGTLANGVQLSGRNLQLVGIILYRTVLAEIVTQEGAEIVELLVLVVDIALLWHHAVLADALDV